MVEFKFERFEVSDTAQNHTRHLGDTRFRQLFSAPDWFALPAPVRARFGRRVGPGEAILYRGQIIHTRLNRAGRALAFALRLVGAPLPLERAEAGAPAVVSVTEDVRGGQFWSRQYGRADGRYPQIIQSAKQFKGATGIEEHIGAGIGMELRACVEAGELVFRAVRMFWQGPRNWRIHLPQWLTPSLRAGHEEIGRGWFDFTLRVNHQWFGKMVDQRIRFKEAGHDAA